MGRNTTKVFSSPLMKQTFKANIILAVVILIVMCLMANVTNYAMSIMATETKEGISEKVQEDLYAYMFVLASYNQVSGNDLSYDGFAAGEDRDEYKKAFDMYNMTSDEEELTVSGFEEIVNKVEAADTDADVYVKQFEYVYALAGEEGCFSGDELKLDEFMEVMLEAAGIGQEDLEKIQDLDFTTFFTKIYFTVIGMLPTFVFIIIVANSLIAAQVDKGSMAYILSTPTRRSAVAITQAVYMILAPLVLLGLACAVRCASTFILFDEVNVPMTVMLFAGMYLVTEAAAAICYFCSCVFDQSSKALAIGGGITLWFFLASLLGMFGSEDLVNMGIGAEVLSIFNKLTIISLFDAGAVQTIGSSSVDLGFIPGMCILIGIAIVFYVSGAIKFCKKDLPL